MLDCIRRFSSLLFGAALLTLGITQHAAAQTTDTLSAPVSAPTLWEDPWEDPSSGEVRSRATGPAGGAVTFSSPTVGDSPAAGRNQKARSDAASSVDLVARSIGWGPAPVEMSETGTVEVTIGNEGSGSAQDLTVEYYLSEDNDLNTSGDNYYLGDDRFDIASSDVTEALSFVPEDTRGLEPGDYYVIVRFPSEGEFWRINGQTWTVKAGGASDMRIRAIAWSPNPAGLDEQVTIGIQTENAGPQAFENRRVEYYLSTDTTISTNDVFIGEDFSSLGPGATGREEIQFTPQNIGGLSAGAYYVIVVARSEEEAWYRNDKTLDLEDPEAGVDLVARSIDWQPAVVQMSETATIEVTIGNDGGGSAQDLTVKYYLSEDNDLTTTGDNAYLGDDRFDIASSDVTETLSFVPEDIGGLEPGDYYVIVRFPSEGEFWRSNERTLQIKAENVPDIGVSPQVLSLQQPAPDVSPSDLSAPNLSGSISPKGQGQDAALLRYDVTKQRGAEATRLLRTWRKGKATQRLWAVELNAEVLAAAEGFTLNLPEARYEVLLRRRTLGRTGSLIWSGQGAGGDVRSATFVRTSKGVSGSIRLQEKTYEMRPLGDGAHALILQDPSAFPQEAPPIRPDGAGSRTEKKDAASTQKSDGTVADLLVVYTPAAAAKAGDVEGLVQAATSETNQSYVDSGIFVQVRLVGIEPVDYTESGDDKKDLARLRKPNDGYLDEVARLRDDYRADMVIMISEMGRFAGVAYVTGYHPYGAPLAFGLVDWDYVLGQYTFSHEIGHIQGAEHDVKNDKDLDDPVPYNHGYVNTQDGWRTVMAYDWAECSPGGCDRMGYWSSPDVTYRGARTGSAEREDNVRVLNETGSLIASYRASGGREGEVVVSNAGSKDLVVRRVEVSDEWLSVSPDNTPITIAPGADVALSASVDWLHPDFREGNAQAGEITIVSDDPDEGQVAVAVSATPSDNRSPVARDDAYALPVGAPLEIVSESEGLLGNDTDADGDALRASIVDSPARGTLVSFESDGTFTYQPEAGFSGEDGFTYEIRDPAGAADQARVALTVGSANPPVASNDKYEGREDETLDVTSPEDGVLQNDEDSDGDPLRASLVSRPEHGDALLEDDGTFNYEPDANFAGADSLTYEAIDASGRADTAVVVIEVAPVNDAPTISALSDRDIDEDGTTGPIPFTVRDAESAASSLIVEATSDNERVVPSRNLTLTGRGSDRAIEAVPLPEQSGTATITVSVRDSSTVATESFDLVVQPVNDAPRVVSALPDVRLKVPGPPLQIPRLQGSVFDDTDSELSFTATSSNPSVVQVKQGSAQPARTVMLRPEEAGAASVTITATDGETSVAAEPFTLTVEERSQARKPQSRASALLLQPDEDEQAAVEFAETGTSLSVQNVQSSGVVAVDFYDESAPALAASTNGKRERTAPGDPKEDAAESFTYVSAYHWRMRSGGAAFDTAEVSLRLQNADLTGVGAPDSVTVLIDSTGRGTFEAVETRYDDGGTPSDATDDRLVAPGLTQLGTIRLASNSTANPLPVELSAFDVRLDGDAAVLAWTTASETANAGFEVQHRPPTSRFAPVAFVEGAGTTTEPQTYRFRVPGLDTGTHEFRLRQVDTDGSGTLTSPVEVTVAADRALRLRATGSNPARSVVRFEFTVKREGEATIALYNVLGQRVKTLYRGVAKIGTVHTITAPIQDVPSGLYFARLTTDTGTRVVRVVVVR